VIDVAEKSVLNKPENKISYPGYIPNQKEVWFFPALSEVAFSKYVM
jgi:hypothetical protein